MFRGRDIKFKYIGMIPSSLELNKLIDVGIKTFRKDTSDKLLSSDIINVKFKQKVDSGKSVIKRLKTKIERADIKPDYKEKLEQFIKQIESEIDEHKWNEISQKELRIKLYSEGFEWNGTKYVVYKRSSAKSRIGQCLFIKEKLHKTMKKWSRMGLKFDVDNKLGLDFPSLLAYESLVGSSIEGLIKIEPNNILIVDDVISSFSQQSNVVRTDKNGFLNSFSEKSEIRNSLFDGESLLESFYFSEGKSMMLLRNHMFKSAAFNCNIQEFLKEHCPIDIDYEDWKLYNMFNEKINAKDVHLIITPSSLKALKFSKLFKSDKAMWDYWKKVVYDDECYFGVCKSEKKSKRGFSKDGSILQQTSYQMLNSLPLAKKDVNRLTEYEIDYINKLKNDDQFFIEHILETQNEMNCNEMFAYLYDRNRNIVNTKLFRDFRKKVISGHVTHVKNGKIRLKGDYCVMLGNPMEFLYHSVGKLNSINPESISIKDNEIHTKLFGDVELTGFRNPHTSPNNVLVVKNRHNKDINRFFNLTDNIVCVNAIRFPLQDILSGSDYDSDTVLLLEDDHLLKISKGIFGKYNVCINNVSSSKKTYRINNEDMAIIDNELSNSQKYIGRTVNTGQLCMSRYWDLLNSGKSENEISELMKKIDVVTVLSGICIDLAKKMFDIDINKEIEHITRTEHLIKNKPLFWRYVSQSRDIKTSKYNCPMDFLYESMSNLDYADKKENIQFEDLLIKRQLKESNRRQEKKIFSYVENMVSKINNTYASNLSEEEKERKIEDTIKYCKFYIEKIKISEDTMYSILMKMTKNQKDKIASRLLNVLFSTQKSQFLSAFSEKTTHF